VTASLLRPRSSSNGDLDSIRVEAEGFLKRALDALTEHIAILDDRGRIIHVNAAWKRFAERNNYRAPDYGVGVNYLEVCDKSAAYDPDSALVAKGIRDVMLRKRDEYYLEYPCHSATEKRWYVIRATYFEWYGHVRVIVAHHNVTEIKEVQVELRESKRRLEAILENLVDGVIAFDEGGRIESLNQAGGVIFGYKPEELIGKPLRLLIPELDDRQSSSMRSLASRLGNLGDEMEGRRKDGTTFPMYFAINRLELDSNVIYTAVIQDFTERKFLEQQVWDKERLNLALEQERDLRELKNRFISMMSHELRTPLAAIQLASSMLKFYGDRASETEKREAYDTIDQQVEYLAELVSDVMTISRSDFTGKEFTPEPTDMETWCRDVIESIQHAHRMAAGIEFVGPEKHVVGYIDRKILRRSMTNLLNNAIKYSPKEKCITVQLCAGDGQAIITIRDQGIGIPEADLPRLFEPFHRAGNVGTIQGTGLGLAIARQAVELHGGSISVSSVVGEGTSFTIELPLMNM
jgi:PAS domain S-box-containing protein